ncbi:hypothetical protein BCR44DRAFT_32411 [Catenaria anguillulae PL171]|uniref:Uncharacterized protein n=1 Tax=Catenaria anguillulae PL171 TaxID=765915 RepID=A0A1Y2HKI0_9FUNG|nr:hypothetical protein BCR44DRAFT_32411 [Catenaria anguillulae PL171]
MARPLGSQYPRLSRASASQVSSATSHRSSCRIVLLVSNNQKTSTWIPFDALLVQQPMLAHLSLRQQMPLNSSTVGWKLDARASRTPMHRGVELRMDQRGQEAVVGVDAASANKWFHTAVTKIDNAKVAAAAPSTTTTATGQFESPSTHVAAAIVTLSSVHLPGTTSVAHMATLSPPATTAAKCMMDDRVLTATLARYTRDVKSVCMTLWVLAAILNFACTHDGTIDLALVGTSSTANGNDDRDDDGADDWPGRILCTRLDGLDTVYCIECFRCTEFGPGPVGRGLSCALSKAGVRSKWAANRRD